MIELSNSSPGAPPNMGQNGAFCALMDWALPQKGWEIEHTAALARVYRPAVGNRNRLQVQHNSALTSNFQNRVVVRGCEDALSATSLIDPFPLVSQVSDSLCTWIGTAFQNTTDYPFKIWLSETFVVFMSQINATADQWEMGFFGDAPGAHPDDQHNTVICVRNIGTNNVASLMQATGSGAGQSGNIFWKRDIGGSVKSSRGQIAAAGTALGNVPGMPAARGGFQNRIYRERVGLTDIASTGTTATSLAMINRGWLPNAWSGLHAGRGALNDNDTFTDSAYNPAARFRAYGSGATPFIIMEETDTWSPP